MSNIILETYKDQIEAALHEKCQLFCLIGQSYESPRWVNVDDVFKADGVHYLKFRSTQCRLFFAIEISENHYDYLNRVFLSDFLWNDFKAFRTEFLKEHYPTIKTF